MKIEDFSCSFGEQREHLCLDPKENEKIKLGRYHGSHFVSSREDKYSIAVYIKSPYFDELINKDKKSEQEIINLCISFFNSQLGKKSKKPKYGLLTLHSYKFKINGKGEIYIESILLTSDPNNKHFWRT